MITLGNNSKSLEFLLSQAKIKINKVNNHNETAIIITASTGNINAVRVLISVFDININQKNNEGKTTLIIATESNNIPIVKTLIQYTKISVKGKIACDIYLKVNFGKTTIDYALSQAQELYQLFKPFIEKFHIFHSIQSQMIWNLGKKTRVFRQQKVSSLMKMAEQLLIFTFKRSVPKFRMPVTNPRSQSVRLPIISRHIH